MNDPVKTEMTKLEQAMAECATRLGEYADTVQIFCTSYDGTDGGTFSCVTGTGNGMARYGHVRLWLKEVEESGGQLPDFQGEDDDEEDEE